MITGYFFVVCVKKIRYWLWGILGQELQAGGKKADRQPLTSPWVVATQGSKAPSHLPDILSGEVWADGTLNTTVVAVLCDMYAVHVGVTLMMHFDIALLSAWCDKLTKWVKGWSFNIAEMSRLIEGVSSQPIKQLLESHHAPLSDRLTRLLKQSTNALREDWKPETPC